MLSGRALVEARVGAELDLTESMSSISPHSASAHSDASPSPFIVYSDREGGTFLR
jgi:hypothetical protein